MYIPNKRKTMTQEIKTLMDEANTARSMYRAGLISRDECNARIAPYAEAYNARAKELAKEYGIKFRAFSITSYLR